MLSAILFSLGVATKKKERKETEVNIYFSK